MSLFSGNLSSATPSTRTRSGVVPGSSLVSKHTETSSELISTLPSSSCLHGTSSAIHIPKDVEASEEVCAQVPRKRRTDTKNKSLKKKYKNLTLIVEENSRGNPASFDNLSHDLKQSEEKVESLATAQAEWASKQAGYISTIAKLNEEIALLKAFESWRKTAEEARGRYEDSKVKLRTENSYLQNEIEKLREEKDELMGEMAMHDHYLEVEGSRAVHAYKSSQDFEDLLAVLFPPLIKYGYTLALDRAKALWPEVNLEEESLKDFYKADQQAEFEGRMDDLKKGVDIISKYASGSDPYASN